MVPTSESRHRRHCIRVSFVDTTGGTWTERSRWPLGSSYSYRRGRIRSVTQDNKGRYLGRTTLGGTLSPLTLTCYFTPFRTQESCEEGRVGLDRWVYNYLTWFLEGRQDQRSTEVGYLAESYSTLSPSSRPLYTKKNKEVERERESSQRQVTDVPRYLNLKDSVDTERLKVNGKAESTVLMVRIGEDQKEDTLWVCKI